MGQDTVMTLVPWVFGAVGILGLWGCMVGAAGGPVILGLSMLVLGAWAVSPTEPVHAGRWAVEAAHAGDTLSFGTASASTGYSVQVTVTPTGQIVWPTDQKQAERAEAEIQLLTAGISKAEIAVGQVAPETMAKMLDFTRPGRHVLRREI